MTKQKHLFLVDGSAYIFRAYHALPALTRASDGLPIGAVAGFCNMIWKMLCDTRAKDDGATHFAVVFDHSSKTFRKEIYPQYKANRKQPPEDLIVQFSLIREATKAFNLPVLEREGYEADDIIATIADQAQKQGAKVTIISSDKDLLQLVNEDIILFDGVKNKKITSKEVKEKWGVLPEQMIDLQILVGDSSDNIPGAKGIGPKTAAQLLQQFTTVDNLFANLQEITQPKRREALEQAAENINITRALVTLRKDVPMSQQLEDFTLWPIEGEKLLAFLKAMELYSLTAKVANYCKIASNLIKPDPSLIVEKQLSEAQQPLRPSLKQKEEECKGLPKFDIIKNLQEKSTIINNNEDFKICIDKAKNCGYIAFSLERDENAIKALAFFIQENAFYLPIKKEDGSDLLNKAEVFPIIKALFETDKIKKISYDIKENLRAILENFAENKKIELKAFEDVKLLSYSLGEGPKTFDTLLEEAGYVQIPTIKEFATKQALPKKIEEWPVIEAAKYATQKAILYFYLAENLKKTVIKQKATTIYERLEKPLVPILLDMEQNGVLLDREKLAKFSKEFSAQAQKIAQEIYQIAGEEFNIASPKQLGEILCGKLQYKGGKKTKTGQWSTDVHFLEELAQQGAEIAQKILEWRQLTKLVTTYTEALIQYLGSDQRIHTHYALAATMTGRLASFNPNLQNIPIRAERGRQIRECFIAEPGKSLISADYSQIELRLLAHITQSENLKQAFYQNIDIHAQTAAQIFECPLNEVTKDKRRKAKAINFGIIYGQSAFGLAQQLAISRSEAALYMKAYFEKFPAIEEYVAQTKQFALEKGFVKTIFGRKIYYKELQAKNKALRAIAERAAINAPLQGSAADIIRFAMIKFYQQKHKYPSLNMLLQIHDELIFEVQEDRAEDAAAFIKKIMEEATMPYHALDPKLVVDVKISKNL